MKLFEKKSRSAGVPLSLAGITVFLGIQTAESNFLGNYSTRENYISDLGDNSDSALIFNSTMFIAGILIVLSARRLRKAGHSRWLTIPLTLYGLGTLGVGLFPSKSIPNAHAFSAGLLFITGPVCAFTSRKYLRGPMQHVVVGLGILATISVSNFTIASNITSEVNNLGGLERWAVYPITMWMIVFGSYSAHKENSTAR